MESDSTSSLFLIDNAACIINDPLSTSSSTKCTEQPVIFEPFNIQSFIAEPPLYAGSNEGWIFIILFLNLFKLLSSNKYVFEYKQLKYRDFFYFIWIYHWIK